MKTKLFKRIGALVLACMMCFTLCSTAFAMELVEESSELSETMVMANENHSVIVEAGKTGTIDLGSSWLTKQTNLRIITASNGANHDMIEWQILINDVFTGDIHGSVGANTMYEKPNILLSGGTYKIKIINSTNYSVTVYAYFY